MLEGSNHLTFEGVGDDMGDLNWERFLFSQPSGDMYSFFPPYIQRHCMSGISLQDIFLLKSVCRILFCTESPPPPLKSQMVGSNFKVFFFSSFKKEMSLDLLVIA